ncbi:MAG: hypothetical protein ABII23_01710, partial [bacterium]
MRNLFQKNQSGISYVETLIAAAILAVIAVSFAMIIQMSGVTSVKHQNKRKANQFAQAVIEHLKIKARENYFFIVSDTLGQPKTYNEITGLGERFQGMTAFLTVSNSSGTKEVEIKIEWPEKEGTQQAIYYTRVSPIGFPTGGIATGYVYYYKQLDPNPDPTYGTPHHIPTGDPADPDPDPEYFGGAGGFIIRALSNDGDGSYTETVSGDDGNYTLKNIKVEDPPVPVDITFYKEGSKPNDKANETGYYFFDSSLSTWVDIFISHSGQAVIQATFNEIGEVQDLNNIFCARGWSVYADLHYKNHPPGIEFQEANYTNTNYEHLIKISGDGLRWGRYNSFEADNRDYWDFSENILSYDAARNLHGNYYNLIIRNVRGGYNSKKISLSVGRYNGSNPTRGNNKWDPDTDPNFKWGTIALVDRTIEFNPVGVRPFTNDANPPPYNPHLAAPTIPGVNNIPNTNSFPLGAQAQGFNNTLNLEANRSIYGTATAIIQSKAELTRLGWITGTAYFEGGGAVNPAPQFTVLMDNPDGHIEGTANDADYNCNVNNNGEFGFYNIIDDDMSPIPNFGNWNFRQTFRCYGDSGGEEYWGVVDEISFDAGSTWYNYDAGSLPDCPLNEETQVKITVLPGADYTGNINKTYTDGFGIIQTVNAGQYKISLLQSGGSWTYGSFTTDILGGGAYAIQDVNRMGIGTDRTPGGIIETAASSAIADPDFGAVEVLFDITVVDGSGNPLNGATVKIYQNASGDADRWIRWDDPLTGLEEVTTGGDGRIIGAPRSGFLAPMIVTLPLTVPDNGGPFARDYTINADSSSVSYVRVVYNSKTYDDLSDYDAPNPDRADIPRRPLQTKTKTVAFPGSTGSNDVMISFYLNVV